MYITKSLYKEFCQFPKLARWHIHDKETYEAINLDTYGAMDGAAIGQEVEDMVKRLRPDKSIQEVKLTNFKDFHVNYDTQTKEVLATNPDIIYQGALLADDLFVKIDFLVKNEQGTYDLVEVKSVNNPMTTTKIPELKSDLNDDVSFQRYVIQKAIGKAFSGKVYLYHINKEFIKNGTIVPREIISILEVNQWLLDDETIEHNIETIRKNLPLSEDEFNKAYPFDGSEYLAYFGKEAEKGTIFNIPRFSGSKKKFAELLANGKIHIKDLTEEDIELLGNGEGETTIQKFIKLYQKGESVDKEAIKEIFAGLKFPLFFYDYETVADPIPIFDGTKPWQATVVQYSLHKMEADGTITHYESIIGLNASNIKKVVDQFVKDVGEPNGTFIVRNKGFECSRNNETAVIYPEYKDFFEKVNAQTFDLMEIFKNLHYFHPGFNGSASIKKVLPVLTEISYDDLEIGNGGIATNLLQQIVLGTIDQKDYQSIEKNLLKYCEQDTWAMVEIYRKVLEKII